jgi:hypothetical protein
MTKEALKLALEALRRSRKSVSGDLDLAGCAYGSNDPDGHRYDDAKKALTTLDKAITAIKEALAQPEQEPVQTIPSFTQLQQIIKNLEHCLSRDSKQEFLRVWIRDWTEHKLSQNTTPPQRKPLTDEEIMNIAKVSCIGISPQEDTLNFAKVIEAVHGIKGEA